MSTKTIKDPDDGDGYFCHYCDQPTAYFFSTENGLGICCHNSECYATVIFPKDIGAMKVLEKYYGRPAPEHLRDELEALLEYNGINGEVSVQ